jgi:hypothetical protein
MRQAVQSPSTSAPDSYIPVPSQMSRPDKVIIMVTADSDRYSAVDISGAKGPALIRERMFTKVRAFTPVGHFHP